MDNAVICAIAKNEHPYINEGCHYYLNLGFSHIYIYDNDDLNSKYIGDFIDQNIKDKVTIFDCRTRSGAGLQCQVYKEFYISHQETFNGCAFFDIDEFLVGIDDINGFLSQEKFKEFTQILIRGKLYDDNNITERDESQPVFSTFTHIAENPKLLPEAKCIVKTGIKNFYMFIDNFVDRQLTCFPSGKGATAMTCVPEADYSNEVIFLNHYRTKSLKEFIDHKLMRGNRVYNDVYQYELSYYGAVNTPTKEKIDYLKKNYPNINICIAKSLLKKYE